MRDMPIGPDDCRFCVFDLSLGVRRDADISAMGPHMDHSNGIFALSWAAIGMIAR